jgi:hypothetical protein
VTDPAADQPDQIVRIVLDATAISQYGRSVHVGEVIANLGAELELDAGLTEPEALPGVPAFGVPVLALSTAIEQAPDKHALDLILGMLTHPWCVLLPVTAEQVRRPGDLGWEQPLPDWTAEVGSQETAHTLVCAIDHRCTILTAAPDDYASDGDVLDGLLIRIPDDGDSWPDERNLWPTDPHG